MKIGLSFSRCVRDIVEGKVDICDVLVVVARTDFDPHDDKQWSGIWRGYRMRSGWSNPEWGDFEDKDEQQFRDVSCALWDTGKLHQPRQFGAHPRRLPYYWLEAVLPDSELEDKPGVKEAWDQFQVLAGLASVKLDKEYR